MKKIGQYGDVAVLAVHLTAAGEYAAPRSAWDEAAKRLVTSATSRVKTCPETTFLTLCQEGQVTGIRSGHYTTGRENYELAMKAISLLKDNPELAAGGAADLWRLVIGGGKMSHQGQMDVVLGLWRAGLIVGTAEIQQLQE